MKFYPESGVLEVVGLILMRQINVPSMIEKSGLKWEDWSYSGKNALGGGRLVFDLSYPNGEKMETILIVHFNKKNGNILSWNIVPTILSQNESWGTKKRLIRANKEWFKKETGVLLPAKGEWGEAFVSYDPHNLCAYISCHYKEWCPVSCATVQ
jgi:hypothetical protein